MKFSLYHVILLLFFALIRGSMDIAPLSHRHLNHILPDSYERGIYLIVLAEENLRSWLSDESTGGDFLEFKNSQGYDVVVVSLEELGLESNEHLKLWLHFFKDNNPMLEYVLLVGDWNGTYSVPTYTVMSYNEGELDVTDYTYTFIDNFDEPRFFIGRWPVRSTGDLLSLKSKTIQYTRMDNLDGEYLDDALLVAGNFKDGQNVEPWDWPVTPVWTSLWLYDELEEYGFYNIDTAFYHAENWENGSNNPVIANSWNDGVGVINYRGWGDANGWHKPLFHREDVENLNNSWRQPVVMSFVCNTGDFGNDYDGTGLDKCFGEVLVTAGSYINPKGATAMIGPSDLDTDTRFNNVMCGAMWDELLEGRNPELGPALHAGKDSVATQFDGLYVNETNIPEFYYHIYGVLGDPSIPVWLKKPQNMVVDFIDYDGEALTESYINLYIVDENDTPIRDIVGALLYNGELISKGLSNQDGFLDIDFNQDAVDIPEGTMVYLYLNHHEYFQKKIPIYFEHDNEGEFILHEYIPEESSLSEYIYTYNLDDGHQWVELSPDLGGNGTNACLSDDTVTDVSLGFDFTYFGRNYDSITIGSNGWVSLEECNIPYFWNFSIPFPMGPSALIAPFMDDLDDNAAEPYEDTNGNCMWDDGEPYSDRNENGIRDFGEDFKIYFHSDIENGRFIVQWHNLSNGEDDQNCPDCIKETFQVILLDPNMYPNTSGQGDIIFIYQEIHDIDENGNYSTIGVESPDQNFGTQIAFSNSDSDLISQLNDGYAIRLSAVDNPLSIENSELILEHSILKTYPNPFNSSMNITYELENSDYISISLFDISGRLVKNIYSGFSVKGKNNLHWEAGGLPTGMYVLRLESTQGLNLSHKILLIK